MPTYDYQCRKCGTTYEVIHSMLEDGPTSCERCGGQLRRVLYPSGIIFKGSGFYKTDSRSSSSSSHRRPASSSSAATRDGSDGARSGESKAGESKSGESTSGSSGSDSANAPKSQP